MADTDRSVSALQTLLADNTSGDISPQDLRDMLVSLTPAFGGMYISATAPTVFADTVTPVKALGTTTVIGTPRNFSMAASNRLTYTGTADILAFCLATLAVTSAGNNQVSKMSFAKNGTVTASSVIQRKISTGTDVGAASIIGLGPMSTNDYTEVFLQNATSTTNITLENMSVAVFGFVT